MSVIEVIINSAQRPVQFVCRRYQGIMSFLLFVFPAQLGVDKANTRYIVFQWVFLGIGRGRSASLSRQLRNLPGDWAIEMQDCYEELLAGEVFPCLAGQDVWIYPQMAGIPTE